MEFAIAFESKFVTADAVADVVVAAATDVVVVAILSDMHLAGVIIAWNNTQKVRKWNLMTS